MNISFLILFFVVFAAYLIGSFPTGYIIGKMFSHVDVREVGSGNTGATNVVRCSGFIPGAITLLIDVGKGMIVSLAVLYWVPLRYLPLLAGLGVIIGHNWPVFLKFEGGKGVATTVGVCLVLFPKAVISVVLVWFLVMVLSRYVSLSSIISALTLPIFIGLYYYGGEVSLSILIIYGLILGLLILWRHQDNIKRLIFHQEKKFIF